MQSTNVTKHFRFLCCDFDLFVFIRCLVYPMMPVSLDFTFLIAPSVFSNVYLNIKTKNQPPSEVKLNSGTVYSTFLHPKINIKICHITYVELMNARTTEDT